MNSNSVFFISIDSKKYIVKCEKISEFDTFEDFINTVSSATVIDLETESSAKNREVLRYLKEYVFFGLPLQDGKWYYLSKNNRWERDLERYDTYYEKIGKHFLEKTEILSQLNLTKDVISFLISFLLALTTPLEATDGESIPTLSGSSVDIKVVGESLGIDERQLITLSKMVRRYQAKMRKITV